MKVRNIKYKDRPVVGDIFFMKHEYVKMYDMHHVGT